MLRNTVMFALTRQPVKLGQNKQTNKQTNKQDILCLKNLKYFYITTSINKLTNKKANYQSISNKHQ